MASYNPGQSTATTISVKRSTSYIDLMRTGFILKNTLSFAAIVIAKEIHLEIFLPVNHKTLHRNCSIAYVSSLVQWPSLLQHNKLNPIWQICLSERIAPSSVPDW